MLELVRCSSGTLTDIWIIMSGLKALWDVFPPFFKVLLILYSEINIGILTLTAQWDWLWWFGRSLSETCRVAMRQHCFLWCWQHNDDTSLGMHPFAASVLWPQQTATRGEKKKISRARLNLVNQDSLMGEGSEMKIKDRRHMISVINISDGHYWGQFGLNLESHISWCCYFQHMAFVCAVRIGVWNKEVQKLF